MLNNMSFPMKNRSSIIPILFVLGISLGIMGLQFSSDQATYEPILMKRSDMEAAVKMGESRPIESPGKMWLYNNRVFLIEQYKGIHIIDNSDPSNASTIAFLQIDGCTDLTMKDNIIYANNAIDMIGIKGNSDFSSIAVVVRNRSMLPRVSSPNPWDDSYYYSKVPENSIIVNWVPSQN